MKTATTLVLMLLTGAAWAAPPTAMKAEIASLFAVLEQSGCEFNRNGAWHDAHQASAHLHRKYAYLLRKGLVTSTESFLDLAASKSSITGKPYLVRCAGAAPVASRAWFGRALARRRARSDGVNAGH